jgi:hypothetical protein
LWCGWGHLHKDCLEKGNASSTPTCCNCQLTEGEAAYPFNYHGCRHAKEESPGNTQKYNRVFSSKLVKSKLSFATALQGQMDKMTHQVTATSSRVPEPPKPTQQETGLSVLAPIVNSENVDTYSVNCRTSNYDRAQ